MGEIPFFRLVKWRYFRRHLMSRKIRGFFSDADSFASKDCSFGEFSRIVNGSILTKSRLGRFSYTSRAKLCNTSIGSFCSIGPGTQIGGFGRHPTHFLSTHPVFYSNMKQVGITFSEKRIYDEMMPVEIGNDVWIGARVIVLDGIKIGDGCIVAAGAVVAQDIPSYSIVGGVPAKLIRKRFSEDVIQELSTFKWWNLSTETLRKIAPMFCERSSWTMDDIIKIKYESLKAENLHKQGNLVIDKTRK